MTADRWARIAEIYQRASDLPAADRTAYLDEACAGDVELRREVDSLIAQAGATALIDQPAWAVAADLLGDNPAVSPGTHIGQYRIEALIGEGGMGQVYRARDTALQREVALKVLPLAFARDPDRLARFSREAQVLASLNHPHVGAIYGIERGTTDPPTHALVLELVDGPTLADRIGQGPLPLDEALPIARQIAEAVEAAHEQGIIHRDLKPANIKLRTDGSVKVLDFGLAKALDPVLPATSISSPTITSPVGVTGAGMLLGTAAYMSPELARGRPADKRSDVWAFGCVLFEMITGTRAFAGAEVPDTLAAIVRDDPAWDRLPAGTPLPIARLLRRSLEKDRSKRLPSIAAARFEIDELLAGRSAEDPGWHGGASARGARRARWFTAAGLAGGIALGSLVTWQQAQGPAADTRVIRFSIPQPPNATLGGYLRARGPTSQPQFAVSRDGRHVVVVANTQGVDALWIRPLDSTDIRVLPGTEGASQPFWSPDSQSIAFIAAGWLKKVALDGGLPITICNVGFDARGGTWNRDDVIVFGSDLAGEGTGRGLRRVPAGGGSPTPITAPFDPAVTRYGWPYFLPDGEHLLFVAMAAGSAGNLMVGRLGSTETTLIGPVQSAVVYGGGHIFFWKDGSILAQGFDAESRRTAGDPFTVADGVGRGDSGDISFSVSDAGTIVQAAAIRTSMTQLTWVDRSGRRLGTVGEPARNAAFALSPDTRRVVVTRDADDGGVQRLWNVDTVTGLSSQMTFGAANSSLPVWSRDGLRLVFSRGVPGALDLFVTSTDGRGGEKPLLQSAETKIPTDWSPDGAHVLFTLLAARTASLDVWLLPLAGGKPSALLASSSAEEAATFSPDGRWVAYQSDELGSDEIFIQPFPLTGAKIRVSRQGGRAPQWRRGDGRELYFLGADGSLMAAPITFGGQLTSGVPVRLFATEYNRRRSRRFFAATSDGTRFLVPAYLDPAPVTPLHVTVNWPATLSK